MPWLLTDKETMRDAGKLKTAKAITLYAQALEFVAVFHNPCESLEDYFKGLLHSIDAGRQIIFTVECHRAVQMQPVGGELGQPGWMIVESVTVGKRA